MISAELSIADEKSNILECFKEIIQSSYLENADTNSYQINDLAVINLQNEGRRSLDKRRRGRSHFFRLNSFVKCCLFFNLFLMKDRY